MSEGQRFFSSTPNLTLRLPGIAAIEFKGGVFPTRGLCTDEQVIAQIKSSKDYGKVYISEEDKIVRDTPKPKTPEQEGEMLSMAMEAIAKIPGVIPNKMPQQKPDAVIGGASTRVMAGRTEDVPIVIEPEIIKPEEKEEALDWEKPNEKYKTPSLTAVSRMNASEIKEAAELLGIPDVLDGDTAAIMKRKVKTWIKQNG